MPILTPVIAAALILAPAPKPAPLPPLLKWKVTGVSSFRNGYSMVLREAAVPQGHLLVDVWGPGQATVGTLWFNTSVGLTIKRIRTVTRLVPKPESIRDLGMMLNANKGKELIFEMAGAGGASEKVTGRFIDFIQNHVLIQSGARQKLYPSGSIRTIEAAKGFTLTTKIDYPSKRIEMKLEGAKGGKIYCSALQRGFSWSPSYSVDLLERGRLRIIAQAALQNTMEDFSSVVTDLITGFPQLAYLDQVDPISSEVQAAASFGSGLPNFSYDPNDNSIVVSKDSSGFGAGGFGGGSGRMGLTAGQGFVPGRAELAQAKPNENLAAAFSQLAQGIPAGDLFSYRVKSLDLPENELSQELLFQAEGAYEDIYTVSLAPPPSPVNAASSQSPEVWHSLAFINPAACPLTPAPALVKLKGQVLAQNELAYTPIKGRAVVKIGLDPEIKGKINSQEMDRKLVEMTAPGSKKLVITVTEVTLEGEITLTNTKTKEVKVEASTAFLGSAEPVPGAEVTRSAVGLESRNPRTSLVWSPTLAPGETKKLSFTYKVFIG